MRYKNFIFICLTLTAAINSNGQVVQDCGCSAALRYDIYKAKNDFYSEMLLARDINQENYRDLQQKAGGNLSIFGVGIGANGENIEKVKQIYQEHLFTRNVSAGMSEYESITTSNISYETYSACMKNCVKKTTSGIDAYIISENEKEIFLELHYAAAQNSPTLGISYNEGNVNKNIKLKPNTWANPTIKIPRSNKKGFSVVFSAGGQYESVVVLVKPYRPLTANLEITYTSSNEVIGSPITYSTLTRNNTGSDKGNMSEIINGWKRDVEVVQQILTMNDGYLRNDDVVSSEGFWASRIGFKATAKDGYLLRNWKVTCSGGGCGGWVESSGYLRNDANMVAYTEKRYSGECRIDFTVETYKMVQKEEKMGAVSTNSLISIVLPPRNSNGVIRYVGGALRLGESNNFLKLIVKTVSPDGSETYDYSINSETDKKANGPSYKIYLQ